MFNITKPSELERKRNFHSEAPAAKHEYRLRKYLPLRLAGEIWEETLKEKLQKAARQRVKSRQTDFPHGLGFADTDKFEPAQSYRDRRSLTQTPDPEGYTIL